MRWENYFLQSETGFTNFWREYLQQKRDILYIMGMGFDPRSVVGIENIYGFTGPGTRDVLIARYFKDEHDKGNPNHPRVQANLDRLQALVNANRCKPFMQKNIMFRSSEDVSVTALESAKIIETLADIKPYSDIIVDISAMPRSVFIPLLQKLLYIIDAFNIMKQGLKNLHVIVAENPSLDGKIFDKGTDDEATFIHGVRPREGTRFEEQKEIWIPLLGENQEEQFEKIRKKLSPVETCPILPFPSDDLRRGDNLINKYGELLFNDADFETKNIVYADEGNPFHVYRLLSQTIDRYDRSFQLINGCKIIVSALSSKLLTIGSFLAVFEKKIEGKNVGIMHVESLEHVLDEGYERERGEIDRHQKLFEIWLAGEPYI